MTASRRLAYDPAVSIAAANLDPVPLIDASFPEAALAAEELAQHLASVGRGGGAFVRLVGVTDGNRDGFTVTVDDREITVKAPTGPLLLDGAYWLLEQLGFSWAEPGSAGVAFAPAGLADGVHEQVPTFASRTLVLGQDALHDEWRPWMAWARRNRLNGVFLHDTPPSRLDRGHVTRPTSADALAADGSGWLLERWESDGPSIRAEAARRGMSIQFGGHHLPALVPRGFFADHPDWFPLRGGVRDSRFNLCVSSAGARAQLRLAAAAFFRRFAGADVYHLWADDIRGGGWCQCDGCGALSPSDQALRATNTIAEVLSETVPGARLAHLAYRDTAPPPLATEPADNVVLLWAPRERCYGHAIDDAGCERNLRYFRQFEALADAFGHDPARISVFEYYSDAILFKGLAPTHLEVLPRDARAYRAAGAGDFQDLMVGDRPWVGPPFHAWWFARCAWDADVEATLAVDTFAARAFGAAAAAYSRYYRELEPAYRELLDRRDFEDVAGRDVLDFADRPVETLIATSRRLPHLARAFRDASQEILHVAGDRPAREAAQARFVDEVTMHLSERTRGWAAALEGRSDEALEAIGRARDALEAITEWDRHWNAPAYAVIAQRMRRAMARHTADVVSLAGGY